jgi:hypothetical protein
MRAPSPARFDAVAVRMRGPSPRPSPRGRGRVKRCLRSACADLRPGAPKCVCRPHARPLTRALRKGAPVARRLATSQFVATGHPGLCLGCFVAARAGRSEKSAEPELARRVGLRRIFDLFFRGCLHSRSRASGTVGVFGVFAKRTHFFVARWMCESHDHGRMSSARWMFRDFAKRTQQ